MLVNTKVGIELDTAMCYCLTLIGSLKSRSMFNKWLPEDELQRQRINNLDKRHEATLNTLMELGLVDFILGGEYNDPYTAWQLTSAGKWVYKNYLKTGA